MDNYLQLKFITSKSFNSGLCGEERVMPLISEAYHTVLKKTSDVNLNINILVDIDAVINLLSTSTCFENVD